MTRNQVAVTEAMSEGEIPICGNEVETIRAAEWILGFIPNCPDFERIKAGEMRRPDRVIAWAVCEYTTLLVAIAA